MSDRDLVLLFVDALNTQGDRNPILISDLQAQIREANQLHIDVADLERLGATMLFHLLRQLVEVGLVERKYDGYLVTEAGRASAEELRTELGNADADQVQLVETAAGRALDRVA
jgi:hypothetical protein